MEPPMSQRIDTTGAPARPRFRLAELVHETVEDGQWIAPVPHGPFIHVRGSGGAILAILQDAQSQGDALGVDEIVTRLHEVIDDVPAHAADSVQEFLDHLLESGAAQVEA